MYTHTHIKYSLFVLKNATASLIMRSMSFYRNSQNLFRLYNWCFLSVYKKQIKDYINIVNFIFTYHFTYDIFQHGTKETRTAA